VADSNQERKIVSVFGSADPLPGSEEYNLAREVGAILAECGLAVANGGYYGTMEASARGAKEHGGKTIGVPCSIWKSSPNDYIDEVIETSCHSERLQTLVELGTAGYVVLRGSTGTLVELAVVWEYSLKELLRQNAGRIVCMGSFGRPLVEMMASVRPDASDCIILAESPDEIRSIFEGDGFS